MEDITVLIADDHPLIREGLRKVLALEPRLRIVAEAANGEEAVNLAKQLKPRIVLMDINMPVINGIEATRIIKQETRETEVIALTIHNDQQYLLELIRAGAAGYLLKDMEADEVLRSILSVAGGENIIHPSLGKQLFQEIRRGARLPPEFSGLTGRELEVLVEIAVGRSNQEIAEKLFISQKTVKNHLTSIFRKLNIKDRTQAALLAVRSRLVEP